MARSTVKEGRVPIIVGRTGIGGGGCGAAESLAKWILRVVAKA